MEATISRKTLERTKDRLFQALQSKYPLEHYLSLVYDATGLELNLCDTSYGIFAKVPEAEGNDPDFDVIDGAYYLKAELSLSPDLHRCIASAQEQSGVYVCRDPLFPHDIAFRTIGINRAMVAYLFCPGRPEGFAPEDLELIDYLGQILSVELQKTESFVVESGLKYEYFIQKLLDVHFSSDEFAEQRLYQLGRRPQPYYYMLYFAFDRPEDTHSARTRYYDQLTYLLPDGLLGTARGRLCMLLPRAHHAAFTPRERQALQQFLEYNQMRCGVSFYYTQLTMSSYAAEQAVASVKGGRSEGRIQSYEGEYLFHLFGQGMNQNWLRAQIFPDLRLLRQHDETYRTELLPTLRAFIFCGRSASAAAARLHIHKSTFFYRMNKIADLLGVDIYDRGRLFACEFSFYLMDYLER